MEIEKKKKKKWIRNTKEKCVDGEEKMKSRR
jgi:hypothetical protein